MAGSFIEKFLEETDHIHIDDKEDHAVMTIISLNSISDTQAEIHIHVQASREAHGDMFEPDYDEELD